MNMLSMLFGAALVALGVIAAGVADRIRGIRVQRASSPREITARIPKAKALRTTESPPGEERMLRDVVTALTQAGYSGVEAGTAAYKTPASQRSTLESWTRGALAQLRAS